MTRALILASRSPRRRALLDEAVRGGGAFAGFVLRVEPPLEEERPPAPGEAPEAYALRLARAKAEEVASRLAGGLGPRDLVLGADTVVDLAGETVGQPSDDDDARRILRRLSGRRQAVVTGVALVEPATGRRAEAAVRTELEMREMSDEEIDSYVASGESRGKAGAYAIQERGDRYVKIVCGSRSNVVGLPLERLEAMLDEFR